MPESKLPPGPWRVVSEDGQEMWIVDANGETVLSPGEPACLIASPAVFLALEALPLLVEENERLRAICERILEADEDYEENALMTLRVIAEEIQALALVDGVDRPHP